MLKSVQLLKWFMINMNHILPYYDVFNCTGFMIIMFVFIFIVLLLFVFQFFIIQCLPFVANKCVHKEDTTYLC